MMLNRYLFLLALCAGFAGTVHAASLSLVYTGSADIAADGAVLVQPGDELTFDVVADFSGPGELTAGGYFDISFDPALLAYVDVQYNLLGLCGGPCMFPNPFDSGGYLEGFGFGVSGGFAGPLDVATLSFIYIGDGQMGDTEIGAAESAQGLFISNLDFVTPLAVDFGSIALREVPVPGAVWLLCSGLLALRGLSSTRVGAS